MPDRPIEEIEERVGERYTVVERFPIERGKIAEFSEAIKEDDPLYTDTTAETARERGYDDVPAPITYPMASVFFQRRQAVDSRPDLGFTEGLTVHGEQTFEYERVPVAGDVLSAEGRLTDVYQREGTNGTTLTFAEFEETYYDEDDEVVLRTQQTIIETDRPIGGDQQ